MLPVDSLMKTDQACEKKKKSLNLTYTPYTFNGRINPGVKKVFFFFF